MILAHVLSRIEPQRVVDFFLLGRFPGTTARAGRQAPLGALFSARAASPGAQRLPSPPAPVEASPLPSHRARNPQSSSPALHFQPGSSTPSNVEGQAQ